MLNDTEKTDIINIIKNVLTKHGIDIDVDKYKDSLDDNIRPMLLFNNGCPFSKYFREKIAAKLNSVYAFKYPNHAIEMLENNDLRLTSLKKNEENDPLEYQEFWYRLGNLSRMIPDNYDITANNWVCNRDKKLPIDKDRKQIYIYCLTRNPSYRHWKEYGNDGKNVCIEYNFKPKNKNNDGAFKCGNVHYDSGYDFDFLREINYYIRTEYGLFFNPTGWTNFALFYKRNKYRWEEETRISLNLINFGLTEDDMEKGIMNLNYKVNEDGSINKDIVCIKNNSDYVNWEIKSITIGTNCPKEDREKIKDIINSNYIHTEIIER